MTSATAVSAYEGSENGSSVETQTQLRRAKDMLTKKDTEIHMLRKESTWMKRELRERDEEIKALKATVKKTPKKKAEAYPTH
jgi:predicted RNase H-like nuclease (RuvC/YqgF family)